MRSTRTAWCRRSPTREVHLPLAPGGVGLARSGLVFEFRGGHRCVCPQGDELDRYEFLEVTKHLSRLRREDGVTEEARSLSALVDCVSAVEDRLDTAEDDREVLHSRADMGLSWMETLARAVTNALGDVIVGRCSQCAEFGILNGDPIRSPVCDDCQ